MAVSFPWSIPAAGVRSQPSQWFFVVPVVAGGIVVMLHCLTFNELLHATYLSDNVLLISFIVELLMV